MGSKGSDVPKKRESLPTPYIDHYDALVMIEPSALTRLACNDAATEVELRPVVATAETAADVVATVRPLVIVVEAGAFEDHPSWTDLAVSVGAQLVLVTPVDVGPALAERVKLAGKAARALKNRPPDRT